MAVLTDRKLQFGEREGQRVESKEGLKGIFDHLPLRRQKLLKSHRVKLACPI